MINLAQINNLIEQDMQAVNAAIMAQLSSKVALINQLGHYIIDAGGKRIRPLVAVLAARALPYSGKQHITVAALIEFIHTATLLHDDVVDASSLRRGRATANATFGNAASVLVGDFIYTRSFQMMTSLDDMRILRLMSQATNVIAEGEVLQLMNCNNPDINEEQYLHVIYNKTACLFEASAHAAAIAAGATEEQEKALQLYGRHLGMAFQLIDDLLDYDSDNQKIGKNQGDDLDEGKLTLPLLHAMQHCTPQEAKMIRQAVEQGNARHLLEDILTIMRRCGSLQYTRQCAEQEADKAISKLHLLADTPYRQALTQLAWFAVQRSN